MLPGHLVTYALEELTTSDSPSVESITTAVQEALVLLGNASCHMSVERRARALTKLIPDLRSMAEDEDFSKAQLFLFRKRFEQRTKDRAEALKCLRKALGSPNQFSQHKKFSEGLPTPIRRKWGRELVPLKLSLPEQPLQQEEHWTKQRDTLPRQEASYSVNCACNNADERTLKPTLSAQRTGRLALHYHNWVKITSDLAQVKGDRLELTRCARSTSSEYSEGGAAVVGNLQAITKGCGNSSSCIPTAGFHVKNVFHSKEGLHNETNNRNCTSSFIGSISKWKESI